MFSPNVAPLTEFWMYVISACPCCGSEDLRRWPAIVSPFVASHACGTRPTNANLCQCNGCSFRFFDTRLTESEVQSLYSGYRGETYFEARHRHEFWYSREVNEGIGNDPAEIASRKQALARVLGDRKRSIATVLDYGGDRGQFIPDGLGTDRFVYDISDAKPIEGVAGLTSVEGRQFDFVMLAHVLEHCSEPRQILQRLKSLGHGNTLFYFEVPYERPSLEWAGEGNLQRHYLNALLKMGPVLKLVDLYSTVMRVKFNKIPPLALQKCSEHLNFFNERSLKALLDSEGFELLESGVLSVFSGGPVSKILYGLASSAPEPVPSSTSSSFVSSALSR
jgi:hypothetical protein